MCKRILYYCMYVQDFSQLNLEALYFQIFHCVTSLVHLSTCANCNIFRHFNYFINLNSNLYPQNVHQTIMETTALSHVFVVRTLTFVTTLMARAIAKLAGKALGVNWT